MADGERLERHIRDLDETTSFLGDTDLLIVEKADGTGSKVIEFGNLVASFNDKILQNNGTVATPGLYALDAFYGKGLNDRTTKLEAYSVGNVPQVDRTIDEANTWTNVCTMPLPPVSGVYFITYFITFKQGSNTEHRGLVSLTSENCGISTLGSARYTGVVKGYVTIDGNIIVTRGSDTAASTQSNVILQAQTTVAGTPISCRMGYLRFRDY